MEKKMENDMETGFIYGIIRIRGYRVYIGVIVGIMENKMETSTILANIFGGLPKLGTFLGAPILRIIVS